MEHDDDDLCLDLTGADPLVQRAMIRFALRLAQLDAESEPRSMGAGSSEQGTKLPGN